MRISQILGWIFLIGFILFLGNKLVDNLLDADISAGGMILAVLVLLLIVMGVRKVLST